MIPRFYLLWLLALAPCSATELKLSPQLQKLVNLATTAPPEFAANAILRVVEEGEIKDKPTRKELIDRAFRLASSAHEPIRRSALTAVQQDYRDSIRAHSYGLQLDRLSLETRAVRLMLASDKRAARDLFLDIGKPAVAPLTCDDSLGWDVSDFYQTLGQVATETFTATEQKHEDHVSFLVDYLAAITSPMQLAPAVILVRNVTVTPEQRQLLSTKLAGAMENVQPDDRSFQGVSSTVAALLPSDMLPSFQRFIAAHASAPRCAPARNAQGPVGVAMVNGAPADSATAPPPDDFARISHDQMELMFTSSQLVSAAERASATWQQRLQDFLTELSNWNQPSDRSPAVFYHQKMSVYTGLLDITSGAQRTALIDEMLHFAAGSQLETSDPEEWYYDLSLAAQRVRTGPTPGRDVIDGFERTGDPILVLAAALDRTFGH